MCIRDSAKDNRHLTLLYDEVKFYRGNSLEPPLIKLPDWESLPYDVFSPDQKITSERLRTLASLPTLNHGLLLITLEAVIQRLPPPTHILGQTFFLAVGDRLNLESFRKRLQCAGYRSVSQVMEQGEYAIRGGVIDIFPLGNIRPFRLDLFGPEIESIRLFDSETQRSLESVTKIDILPAREISLTDKSISIFRANYRT